MGDATSGPVRLSFNPQLRRAAGRGLRVIERSQVRGQTVVVRFYNQRGTAEQWIEEGKEALHWTRLSCHRFRANEVRLLLGVIAYNLGNLLRRLALPLAESYLTGSLFWQILSRIERLAWHPT